ncbi:tyrosine/nicotianamine aminotransferase, pyridoxal phosphate-dependent transferase, partial [Tanacetum coccineum]
IQTPPDKAPICSIRNQQYDDLKQEKTRNRFPLSVLMEVDTQNYQAAVSRIIENTPYSFFMNFNKLLGEASDMLYKKLKEILHVDCHHKPEGSMFSMLNLSDFDDIVDDRDFCMKLAKEESVIVFPGFQLEIRRMMRRREWNGDPQYVDREKSLPRPLPSAAIVEPTKDDDTNAKKSQATKHDGYSALSISTVASNSISNSGVTCEDESKRHNSRAKTKTFEENCYLLPYAISRKEDTAYLCSSSQEYA